MHLHGNDCFCRVCFLYYDASFLISLFVRMGFLCNPSHHINGTFECLNTCVIMPLEKTNASKPHNINVRFARIDIKKPKKVNVQMVPSQTMTAFRRLLQLFLTLTQTSLLLSTSPLPQTVSIAQVVSSVRLNLT